MRKLIAAFSMLCYIASAIGLSISFNYCNDSLSGIAVCSVNELQCCCDNEINKDCCDNRVVNVKQIDDHQRYTPNDIAFHQITGTLLFIPFQSPFAFVYNDNAGNHLPAHPPPDIYPAIPLYLMNSVFRV